ncbi:MAG: preprotein translocase subunit SecY, partial [Phycisphaerae bacterium]
VVQVASGRAATTSGMDLVVPVLKIALGLLLAGAYYWALWSQSNMKRSLENIFAIPELLKKLGFTLALLCIYRIGFHLPLPGLDQQKVSDVLGRAAGEGGLFSEAFAYLSMFTGGNLQQSTLFGLGIMPYISASIIMQLLTTVVPALEKLQKEGPAGYKKIQEYTRYGTVALCLIQGTFWMRYMISSGLIYPEVSTPLVFFTGVLGLTAGTVFLMWLGEQIDEYGIGNGISLLIMAGIVASMPAAIYQLSQDFTLDLAATGEGIGPMKVVVLAAMFVFVIAGAILITQGQRRIPIQQAKHTRGRRVYGGQRHYMPLRVNHGGVMPIIFASSLMIFPGILFRWLSAQFGTGGGWGSDILVTLSGAFQMGSFTHTVVYIIMIFFFAYFWTTVQFRPKEMADQLRDQGHFIPGLRPGKRTAEYLERVMERITYCGAAFLAAIAVIPTVVNSLMGIPFGISAFLGGTGLLIMVSVGLDVVQRIEANLVMRNYGGFLGGSARIKGSH